jgi:hypothetical protein
MPASEPGGRRNNGEIPQTFLESSSDRRVIRKLVPRASGPSKRAACAATAGFPRIWFRAAGPSRIQFRFLEVDLTPALGPRPPGQAFPMNEITGIGFVARLSLRERAPRFLAPSSAVSANEGYESHNFHTLHF